MPRHLYRRYLQGVLEAARRHAAPRTQLTRVHELVTSLHVTPGVGQPTTTLGYDQGGECRADHVVLALGAPAPTALTSLGVSPTLGMISDPWCPGIDDAMEPSGDVLILGTGLTMIGLAVALTGQDPGRTVHARSRHGLLPTEHTTDGLAPWPGFDIGQPTTAREVVRRLRRATAEAESSGGNWRRVIGAARTAAPAVWGGLDDTERRRLRRHVGRQWEVARHRMQAPVADAVAQLRASGRLAVDAGRVLEVVNHGSVVEPRLEVTLGAGEGKRETLMVSAVIDCTGPGPDPTAGSPLVAGLVENGLARLHPTGVGLDVDCHGDLRTASGAPIPVHTVGWCRRREEFESTAVPEIRRQAQHIATSTDRRAPVLIHA